MYELSRQYFINFNQAIEDLERIKNKYAIDLSRQNEPLLERKFYFEVMNNLQRLEKVFNADIKEGFSSYVKKLKEIGCVTRDEYFGKPWRQKSFTGPITNQIVAAARKKNADFGVLVISDLLNFGSAYYDNIKEYTSHQFMGKKIENSRIDLWLIINRVNMESKDKVTPVDIVVTVDKKKKKMKKSKDN